MNEVLPLFSRLVEVFLQREKSVTLLETYLGRQTGRRVLEGKVRRGDGEDIHAVIWFTDLRQSSTLAATMSRAAFLERLNCFFDCMAGAVLDNEGEVLRFIGDAALGIFPIERSVEAFNVAAREAGEPLMDYGIGLHIGDVTYGNIGTASRLEFTVIGAAANEAARIESLSKTLGRAVLLSEDFVAHCPGRFRSLGTHHLRGTEHAGGGRWRRGRRMTTRSGKRLRHGAEAVGISRNRFGNGVFLAGPVESEP